MTTLQHLVPGIVVVAVGGEVDMASADDLRSAVRSAVGLDCTTLVIDLGAVTFMDSQGLKALLDARSAAADGHAHLVLVGAPRQVRAVLDMTGTTQLFDLR